MGISVHGQFVDKPIVMMSATADQKPRWLTISLSTKKLSCETGAKRSEGPSIQVVIPSGPEANFFVGNAIPIAIRLTGGAGISVVPASHAWIRIDRFAESDQEIRGHLWMKYSTGSEANAPLYELDGDFRASICSRSKPEASVPMLDLSRKNIGGRLSGKDREFPNVVAYLQKDSRGETTVTLKGYTKEVSCYAEGPNTPYLFGAEFGPGLDGRYFVGTAMPADWAMQVSTAETSERTIHAGDGAGYLIIDEAQLKPGGRVKGRMIAETVGETEAAWHFSVSGQFQGIVCEQAKGTL